MKNNTSFGKMDKYLEYLKIMVIRKMMNLIIYIFKKMKVLNNNKDKYMFFQEGIIDINEEIGLYQYNNVILLNQLKKKY